MPISYSSSENALVRRIELATDDRRMRRAFGFFTRALGIFAAYGPIAFAAGLLTWVYLTAVIILLGAELIKVRTAK